MLPPLAFDPSAARRGAEARRAVREGRHRGHTSGVADDLVQANLVLLPQAWAAGFQAFCEANPEPCPLLAVGEPGAWSLPTLGADIDLRRDLPLCRIWRHGELAEERHDTSALWRSDLVAFAIGCSFSFEWALRREGIVLRHVQLRRNVAMYRTNRPTRVTRETGAFAGPLVVTMRPLPPADAAAAARISARFPTVHGAPVHAGDPAVLGIADLARPDYGDAVEVLPGEVPVFWACGVTPQAALAQARPTFCITHAPGSMLITDLLNAQLDGLPATLSRRSP